MSLLQEALKRKEQDKPQDQPDAGAAPSAPPNPAIPAGKPETLAVAPAVSAPSAANHSDPPPIAQGLVESLAKTQASPPPAQPSQVSPPQVMAAAQELRDEQARGRRRKTSILWVIAALTAVFIGATLVAGFAYFLFRAKPSSKTSVVQPVPPAVPPAAVAPADTNQIGAQPVPATAGGVEAAAATQVIQTAVAAQPSAASIAGPQPPPPKLVAKPKAPAAQAAKWPLLKLSGILRGSGQNANTALINGKMINLGQAIENVTLVEIQSDGVILKFGGEKRFLRVGAISY